MPHPDIQPVGVVYQGQKTQNCVKIVQWFPNSHQNDVGNRRSTVNLGKKHLIQHFCGSQVPDLPRNGRSAEGTPHPAPHLAGDAHRIAVLVAHQH